MNESELRQELENRGILGSVADSIVSLAKAMARLERDSDSKLTKIDLVAASFVIGGDLDILHKFIEEL